MGGGGEDGILGLDVISAEQDLRFVVRTTLRGVGRVAAPEYVKWPKWHRVLPLPRDGWTSRLLC